MMIDSQLESLGHRIAQLRYRQQLKQAELAREAGISLRTLQRLEAGDVVKTDVLLKVLERLGRVDELLAVLAPAELSPYEQLEQAGLTSADLGKPGAARVLDRMASTPSERAGRGIPKRRVRRSASRKSDRKGHVGTHKKPATFQWPEDQAS
jgi:transcriptional regulator with XRE-family HTH domain